MKTKILLFTIFLLIASCNHEEAPIDENCIDTTFFSQYNSKSFYLGFSTWSYAKTYEAVDDTYQFISENSDIYSEHIDYKIPWNAWINGLSLPLDFTEEIAARASRKIENAKLSVSVSLLNNERNDLAYDFDGTIPNYNSLDDIEIENAYFKHVKYITDQLNPDYLIIAIEVNELLKNAPQKWDAYKSLMAHVKTRIQEEFPLLKISESITLHNFYQPDVANQEEFIDEIVDYSNSMDFVAISFYPFFKGLKTKEDFQSAFDFLHERIDKPIAFAETGHLSEDLTVDSYNLFIAGNQCEQNEYLESLFTNAQKENYEYVIWWTHRDYNELWETFPIEVQDLGKLWISTGIINEDGIPKQAYSTWKIVYKKNRRP